MIPFYVQKLNEEPNAADILQISQKPEYLFSVIVVAKDEERFIGECLDSINRQTFIDFEVVIVDDASVDSTLQIINRKSKSNYTVLSNGIGNGRAQSRNLAVSKAKGKYLVILDADDIANKERLSRLGEIILAHTYLGLEVEVIVGKIQCISFKGRPGFIEAIPESSERVSLLLSNGLMPFAHSASCIRRDLFIEVGGYPNFARCQDLALFIKLRSRKFVIDDHIHTYYRRKLITPYTIFRESAINARSIRREFLKINKRENIPILWLISELKRLLRGIRSLI
jgi:glycosyltransferase involved in cell wall biosynthesis